MVNLKKPKSLRLRLLQYVLFAYSISISSLSSQSAFWQDYTFSRADSLRGSLRPERTCYDVTFYELDITVDVEERQLEGYIDIHYLALQNFNRLQIDLFANMQISRIEWEGTTLPFERMFDAVFIDFPTQRAGTGGRFRVYYRGQPRQAIDPPWDGGFVWRTDEEGRPWVTVACQGVGASLWWPNKDHLSDEPDSMAIRVTVPADLHAIANGHLRSISRRGAGHCYEWFVSYPINNYNVSINIGRYVHLSDRYKTGDGQELSLDYYVLENNQRVAERHFAQVREVLTCLEKYLGPYPFPRDGFALIETPYNGMEHQSGIAYGNRYMKGYLGDERVRGVDFDYVIMHEAAHEYFGNSLSCTDMADIWLHESFATYLESLFVECRYGSEQALQYLGSQRYSIENRVPIVGPKNINWDHWDNSDNYNKGAWMLHTLRNVLQNDDQWFALLRGFYERYRYNSVTTEDWIQYACTFTGRDFRPFFRQYLYRPELPRLEYNLADMPGGLTIRYRWRTGTADFRMPVQIYSGRRKALLNAGPAWQEAELPGFERETFRVAEELYLVEW